LKFKGRCDTEAKAPYRNDSDTISACVFKQ
jgi:hypothetical protein